MNTHPTAAFINPSKISVLHSEHPHTKQKTSNRINRKKKMRTGATSFHFSPLSKMAASQPTSTGATETFSPPATIQRSPWHSPVPYLFGGLAAMLGLIAFALLILACSYWKLSGQVNGGDDDVEGGPAVKGDNTSGDKSFPVFEEKFLVIMAGDAKPTFLATPTTSKASSFNDDNKGNDREDEKNITIDHNQTELRIQENGETISHEESQQIQS